MTYQDPSSPPAAASGRTLSEWLQHLSRIGADHGFFERVGRDHMALFVQENETLVVSFDAVGRVYAEAPDGLPLGFEAVQRRNWSLLSLMGRGGTWFRDPDLYGFFDALTQQDFFGSFEHVIFLGYGPAFGHAACAFSAAAPGARVLATAPAATLEPRYSGFDPRTRPIRRFDLSRYSDAPTALQSAHSAVLLFDPHDAVSAAHAAQFRGENILRAPVRFAGPDLHKLLVAGDLTVPFLRALSKNRLNGERVSKLLRPVRRTDADYLWRLVERLQSAGQFDRAGIVAAYGADVTSDESFAVRAAELGVDLGEGAATEPAL